MQGPIATPAEADPLARNRALVIAVASLSALMLYLDRVCISILGEYIPEELGLDLKQWAWVLGAFFYAYALCQVPSGWLGDKFGPRRTLTLCIIGWSAFTAATGLANGFLMLVLARLACGVTQAGAYPCSAILMRRWVPLSSRGKANSLVTLGGRLGGALAPALTAALLVALVPAGVSYRIATSDLLKPKELGRALSGPAKGPLSGFQSEVGARLSRDESDAARRMARAEKPVPADVALVGEGLNRLLAERGLADGLGAARGALPSEAAALLRVSPERRTPSQTERLNRFALEVGFPTLIRQVYGVSWRRVLIVYGVVGFGVALLFWVVVRDQPPLSSKPEPVVAVGDDVSRDPGQLPGEGRGGSIVGVLLRSANMWLCGLVQFGINVGWIFLITLFPTYLTEVFQVPLEERGRMMAVPLIVGCFGMFAGGILTDRLARTIGLRWGRALPIGLSSFGCAAALLACPLLPSAWAVVAALSIMAAIVDLGVPSIWAFVQDVGGRDSGAALGWGNMCGNLGAAVSPVFLAWVRLQGGWDTAFAAGAGAFVVAGLAGLALDGTKPLRKG